MTGDEGERGLPAPAPASGPGRQETTTPRLPLGPILLLLVVGAVLLAIGLLTGGNDHQATPAAGPQPLSIEQPTDSATVQSPLEVIFSTQSPLRLTAGGWQAGTYHLHAMLDGTEIMPGALDIRYLGEHRFRWRIKAAPAGPHTLRLVWARADHRAIPEGASPELSFQLE